MLTLREALTRATSQFSAHPALQPTALQDAVRGEQGLTRTLLARADTVIVHSAAQAAQARALAAEVPIVIARMPPHLGPPDPEPYWSAYLHALGVTPA